MLLTPRQYFEGKLDEDEVTNEFMIRFLANCDEYVRGHPSPEVMRDFVHVPANRVSGILNGTRVLTPETALRLERFFAGTSAQFWLNLQSHFDLRKAELHSGKELRAIRPYKALKTG